MNSESFHFWKDSEFSIVSPDLSSPLIHVIFGKVWLASYFIALGIEPKVDTSTYLSEEGFFEQFPKVKDILVLNHNIEKYNKIFKNVENENISISSEYELD